MPHQRVNGVELYWELHGPEDGEPLVLNNGVFMTTASWAFQIPEFARRYRVLAYDMRGQGRSAHPAGVLLKNRQSAGHFLRQARQLSPSMSDTRSSACRSSEYSPSGCSLRPCPRMSYVSTR